MKKIFFVSLSLGLLASFSSAQTVATWSGASSGVWNLAGNWSGGVVPGAGGGGASNLDVAIFNNAVNTSVSIPSVWNISGIEFGDSAGAFTIGTGATELDVNGSGLAGTPANGATIQTTSGMVNAQTFASLVKVRNAGTLSLLSNATSSSAVLNFTGGVNYFSAIGLTVGGTNTGNNAISGNITGSPGVVTKQGSGTWIFSGNNSYTGATTISAGTLIVASSTALGVGGGSGTNVQVIAVQTGATLNLFGTGTVGSLTLTQYQLLNLNSGGTLAMTLAFDGTSDKIATASSLTLNGLLLLDGTINYSDSYTLFSGFTGLTKTGLTIGGYDTSQYVATLGSNGVLSFNSVPEPSSLALLGVGAGLFVLASRRFLRRGIAS